MSSVLCGQPTPTGPCRRPVTRPGGPCGVTHPTPVSPTGAPPSGTFQAGPGVEPLLSGPDDHATPPDPGEYLAALDWRQRIEVASDPLTAPDVLASLVTDSDHIASSTALRNPSCPPGTISLAAAEGERALRSIAAGHPAAPPDVLVGLAGDPDRLVRKAVASNPAASAEALVAVHCHRPRDSRVDAALAAHPATPPGVLSELASSKSTYVRQALADNESTPLEVTARLTRSGVPLTRSLAEAGHPDTSPHQVAALAGHPHPRVRRRVAGRAGLPAGILAVLANDEDGLVAEAAQANPAFTAAEAAHAGLLAD